MGRLPLQYILKRTMLIIPVMFTVMTLVFFLIRLTPGDPVDFILGENALPTAREQLIKDFGFDQPILTQYKNYISSVLAGNLGRSYFSETPINDKLKTRYINTMKLAGTSLFFALIFSFPLGIGAALKKATSLDRGALILSLVGISVPSFYLGPLLALLLSIKLDLFPLSGSELPGSIFLPSLTLGLAMAALLTRIVRSSLLEVLPMDYVRTAKAKGLSPTKVILKHAFRTALIPVIAILGLQFGTLLAGAVITEKVFSWPGIGTLMLDAIMRKDYSLVQSCVLLISLTYVVINLLTDLTYNLVDPRLRLEEGA